MHDEVYCRSLLLSLHAPVRRTAGRSAPPYREPKACAKTLLGLKGYSSKSRLTVDPLATTAADCTKLLITAPNCPVAALHGTVN